jgi:hypothetical protein
VFSSTGKLVYKEILKGNSITSVAQGDKRDSYLVVEMRFFVIHLNGIKLGIEKKTKG